MEMIITVANMVTVQNSEVTSGKLNVVRTCTSGNCTHTLIVNLYHY